MPRTTRNGLSTGVYIAPKIAAHINLYDTGRTLQTSSDKVVASPQTIPNSAAAVRHPNPECLEAGDPSTGDNVASFQHTGQNSGDAFVKSTAERPSISSSQSTGRDVEGDRGYGKKDLDPALFPVGDQDSDVSSSIASNSALPQSLREDRMNGTIITFPIVLRLRLHLP